MAERNDIVPIANVRGLGAMIAFDLPDGVAAKEVTSRALDSGLIILTCGTNGETVRILVPLTISDAVLDEGLNILAHALARPQGST